jgi:AcrR family transcriptional regulator
MSEATRLLAGSGQASVQAIATAAGVSKSTFYRSFPSREHLLDALDLEPEPGTRDRILEAALRLLATRSLADLSMDELASEAGVSRANLYRLFPGKPALFKGIVLAYSPLEPVMGLFERESHRPVQELVPELVRTAYQTMEGRTGIVRTLLFEVTSMTADSRDAFRETGLRAFGVLAAYLAQQMDAGRIRRMHPVLAVQSLIGPVMLHLLARPVLDQVIPGAPRGETAATELAGTWLLAMRPD